MNFFLTLIPILILTQIQILDLILILFIILKQILIFFQFLILIVTLILMLNLILILFLTLTHILILILTLILTLIQVPVLTHTTLESVHFLSMEKWRVTGQKLLLGGEDHLALPSPVSAMDSEYNRTTMCLLYLHLNPLSHLHNSLPLTLHPISSDHR